jgi:hypothetical protein
MILTETKLWYFGAAMILFAVFTGVLSAFFNSLTAEAIQPAPFMRLTFVQTVEQVNEIVGKEDGAREGLKRFLLWDSAAFVPLYSAFFIAISFLLASKQAAWASAAAKILVFAAIIAAASDLIENYNSYLALSDKTEYISRIYWAAHVKWLAIFIVTGLASAIFLRFSWWGIAGATMLAASILGLILIATSLLGSIKIIEHHQVITAALGLQLLALLIVGVCLMTGLRQNFFKGY